VRRGGRLGGKERARKGDGVIPHLSHSGEVRGGRESVTSFNRRIQRKIQKGKDFWKGGEKKGRLTPETEIVG